MQLIEFGTIMNMAKGKKPANQSQVKKDGYMPYVDIKAFETNTVENYTDGVKCLPCNEGDILIVCDGSRSGLVGKAIDGYVGSTLAKITADGMMQNYLFYFLQGKYALLNTKKKGTGTPHLNPDLLKKQKLLVPPLPEQERIVTRIEELFSELDKAVETLQNTKQQLAVYRQAVLKEAFETFKRKSVPERHIADICDYIVDCPHSTPKWVEEGKLCLRTTNFRKGFLDLSKPNYVSNSTFENRITRLRPMPGDVLYSREGAILGIACIIPKGLEVCLGQRMMLLRTGQNMNNKFMMHYLNSPFLNSVITENIGGSASPHINVGDIKKFLIPVPDINEQDQTVQIIESRLSVCESIEQTVDTALAQAEAMRQSILKQAFEGGFN